MKRRIIDISHWQGAIDFRKVKAAGVDGVIIKAGGYEKGYYEDANFENNYALATAAGLDVGAYYFFQCGQLKDAQKQARHFLQLTAGKRLTLPLYCDAEQFTDDVKLNTASVALFAQIIEDAGYFSGVYASGVWGFRENFIDSWLVQYSHWVADYTRPATAYPSAHMHQFSSAGAVDGINGNVDLNDAYIDFAKIIKDNHFNNL